MTSALAKLLTLRSALAMLAAGAGAIYRWGHDPISLMVLSLVFLAAPFTWLAIEGPIQLVAWIRRARYQRWMGCYFAYEGQQVRVHWDATTLWVNAQDIFDLLGECPDRIERKKLAARLGNGQLISPCDLTAACFAETAVTRYLNAQRKGDAYKVRRWLEREVFPNIRRLRENGGDQYLQHALDGGEGGGLCED